MTVTESICLLRTMMCIVSPMDISIQIRMENTNNQFSHLTKTGMGYSMAAVPLQPIPHNLPTHLSFHRTTLTWTTRNQCTEIKDTVIPDTTTIVTTTQV